MKHLLHRLLLPVIVAAASLAGVFAARTEAAPSPQRPPNIILVITDDQGKNDLACEGNPWVQTPNLDRFHSESVRFTNFHVSTTCAPTRGALLSGRHTDRINVPHTIAGRSLLFDDERILPEILAQNGYATAMFGKWHLGDNYPYRPEDRGFQEAVWHAAGGVGQGPDYWGNDYFDDTYHHNGRLEKFEGYCTDVFFREALRFIEANRDRPFFTYIATNAPHGPLNCPEDYIDRYADIPELNDTLRRFYGMITNIDDNFGRLRARLAELGLADNTILIFMTDNGTAYGSKAFDAGMSGHKGSVLEGGHRVPFYIQWPAGGIGGGRDIGALTAHFDVLPTLVELAGLRFTPHKPLDGRSLVPLLRGETPEWIDRIITVDTQRVLNLTKYKAYSVMQGEWRLVNGNRLYDLRTDLKQQHNVIDQHPEIAERLALAYEGWWASLLAEGADTRHAWIRVGTPWENPTRLAAHDLLSVDIGRAWHQFGIIEPTPAVGLWKVDFVSGGRYRFALRRFPRESGLAINATFPAAPKQRRIADTAPAATKDDFAEARLYIGAHAFRAPITDEEEIVFEADMPPGRFDVDARLIDRAGRFYPAYYLYIEKL
ncbi:MAG: arylsulfatase [Verrucomicrobia bacterium]|nr:MAG: arylsulfatase [Verrucomicrobiota bacterium]